LHGGHVLSFFPRGHEPVLWVSKQSRFETGKAIRGGIPVCWPWFADHPTGGDIPAHGFVRTALWTVTESEALKDGRTRLGLVISDNNDTRTLWPYLFRLEIDVTVGTMLKVELIATNTGKEAFTCGGALHSYFHVSSISNVVIKGLEGCSYIDKVDESRRGVQEGSVTIDGETDRIYLEIDGDCLIEDNGLQRRIGIAKSGSRTTVVWNPWVDKARAMKDFGDQEYHSMVCVETANAAEDLITVAPGEAHRLQSIISVESLTG
jgi:D-hexose-6-phosphate mutarotase